MPDTPGPIPHPHRTTIAPIPAGVQRPLWSVMIPTYNCARYLGKALESVLAQDPGPAVMQIEVVDDHSTADDPAEVVRSLGSGRIVFHRQPQNVGHVRNFATCLNRSRGRLIHLLHGEDYVQPGFYRAMQAAFDAQPEVGLATCRHIYSDADGHWFGISRLRHPHAGVWRGAHEELAMVGDVQTPSVVVRRECYETLGGFDQRLLCTEDYEMWARIAGHYPVWYEPECLAVYRFHHGSNTARDVVTGENIRDYRRAVGIIADELPAPLRPGWQRIVMKRVARASLERVELYLEEGRAEPAMAVLREALRCDAGPGTLARVVRSFGRAAWRRARRALHSGQDAADPKQGNRV